MALAANIHFDGIAFFRGTRFERRAARARHGDLVIVGMNVCLHNFTSPALTLLKSRCSHIIYDFGAQVKLNRAPFKKFLVCHGGKPFAAFWGESLAKFLRLHYNGYHRILGRVRSAPVLRKAMKIWKVLAPGTIAAEERPDNIQTATQAKVKVTKLLLSPADLRVYAGSAPAYPASKVPFVVITVLQPSAAT